MNDVAKLFGKIALLSLPFAFAVAIFLANAESPIAIKQRLIQDKIERLVVSATSSPRVIIAGESRAEQGLVPDIFSEQTKLTTVSIAVADGGFAEEYDALRDLGAFDHKRIVVMGISSYELNDRMLIFLQPLDSPIIANEPWSFQKISDIATFTNGRALYYVQQFKSFYRGTSREAGRMDETTFANKGWRFDTEVYVPGKNNWSDEWQVDFDAMKKEDFSRAALGFASSTDILILFTGPVAPSAKRELAYESTIDLEKNFAEHVRQIIAPYPNIYFIDFRTMEIPELTDEKCGDAEHLNAEGAGIFTAILVKTLKDKRILKF